MSSGKLNFLLTCYYVENDKEKNCSNKISAFEQRDHKSFKQSIQLMYSLIHHKLNKRLGKAPVSGQITFTSGFD